MSNYPSDWKILKLADCLEEFVNGYAFDANKYSEERKYPILRMSNIGLGGKFQYHPENSKYCPPEEYESLSKFHVKFGDVIMAMTDVTPGKELIGASTIVNTDRSFVLNQRVGLLRFKKDIVDNKFFAYWSNGDAFKKFAKDNSGASAQANLGTSDIKSAIVVLPTLTEQKKIAEILTSVDKVIELTEIEIEKLKNLKKGMMQDLLTKGIGHTKFKDSPIGKIPESWECIELGNIVSNKTMKNPPDSGRNLKYIALEHIESETFQLIAHDWSINTTSANTLFKSGDVLFGKLRPYLRKSVTPGFDGCCTGELLVLKTNNSKLKQQFLKYIFQQESIYQYCEGLVAGTKMPRVSWVDLKEFQVLLPGIDEQNKIVSAISSVDTQINVKVKKHRNLLNLKKGLMQDLLTGKVRVKV